MACEASRFGNIQKFRISRPKMTQGYSPAGFCRFSNSRRHTVEFRRLFEEECPWEEKREVSNLNLYGCMVTIDLISLKLSLLLRDKWKKYHHFTLQDTVNDPFFLKKCLIYFTLKNKMINPPFVVLTFGVFFARNCTNNALRSRISLPVSRRCVQLRLMAEAFGWEVYCEERKSISIAQTDLPSCNNGTGPSK